MRIFLQTQPAPGESPKYYQLQLEQDLFGGWSLVRESGQQGSRATVKREQYLDFGSAQEAMEKARDAQVRKGRQPQLAPGFALALALSTDS